MREEKKRGRRKMVRILAVVVLLAGIGVMLYPYALQWTYDRQANEDYRQFLDRMSVSTEEFPYRELYEKMQAYNDDLYTNGQSELTDPWAYEESSFNLTEYGFEDNVIGYIEIPKIGVVLPIYLGASEENMRKGAVHLSQTSLPIGGENTNCVIAGHRNYHGATLFTPLVELTEGDEVIVTNLWYTMTYRVTETTVILADEIDRLKIQDKNELLTLFTCYYTGNRSDRFVVFCERVG